jgi:hypothetical protein
MRYWHALGIDLFVPLRKLSGAPSEHIVYRRTQKDKPVLPGKQTAPTRPKQVNREQHPEHTKEQPLSGQPELKAQVSPPLTDVRFEIWAWFIGDTLCVDLLPGPCDSGKWQSLILSLLNICGWSVLSKPEQSGQDILMLLWPPESAKMLSKEHERAKQYLIGELHTRMKTAKRILAFGVHADGNDTTMPMSWIKECIPTNCLSCCFTHSLSLALTQGDIKASLWDQIKTVAETPKGWF